jgi:hypothetical protein
MKVMVMVKATKKSESGALPDRKLLAEMGSLNEQLETKNLRRKNLSTGKHSKKDL